MALGQEQLGKRIQQAREEADLTQPELAQAIGLKHPQSISNYERGVNEVSMNRLRRIAEVTNKPLSYFLNGPEVAGQETESLGLAEVRDLQQTVDRIEDLLRELLEQTRGHEGAA